MVGLGTQDDLALAEYFVDTYGTVSFPMLWDPTFDSWAALGITGQPAAMLMTSDGRIVEAWSGAIPETQVLDLVDQLTTAGV
ncbi:MAG: hypothetical protein KDB21_06120 [Acidimicrobiales bacterium]|nr:hypothetical protein [Acidimicrobiales bacterium]